MPQNPRQQRVFNVHGGFLLLEFDEDDVVEASHVASGHVVTEIRIKQDLMDVATIRTVILNPDGAAVSSGDTDDVLISGLSYKLSGDCCNYPPLKRHFTGTM